MRKKDSQTWQLTKPRHMQHAGILKFNVNILNKASALQTIWCSSKYDMFVSGTPLALLTSVNKKCI